VKNSTDILQRLHGLTTEDRTWILARLPSGARSTLRAAVKAEQSSRVDADVVAETQVDTTGEVARLPSSLDPEAVAALLKGEPAWIAAALLEGSAEPWTAMVLEHLPSMLRADIERHRRAGCTLTVLARQTLISAFMAGVGNTPHTPVPSKFQSLLDRVSASRSRKRLTIHL
jgi:hypothetical protein